MEYTDASAWRDKCTAAQHAAYNRQAREHARAAGYAAQYEWMRNHPEKRAAMAAVKWALKTGKLTREPCLFCGVDQVEAHHHSYAPADRLSVTWLCRRHHRRVHRTIR